MSAAKSDRTLRAEEVVAACKEGVRSEINRVSKAHPIDCGLLTVAIEQLIDAKIAVALSRPVDDR